MATTMIGHGDPRDAEVARLRAEVAELTRERTAAWMRANVVTARGERTPEGCVADLIALWQLENERRRSAEAEVARLAEIEKAAREYRDEYLAWQAVGDEDGAVSHHDVTRAEEKLGALLARPQGDRT